MTASWTPRQWAIPWLIAGLSLLQASLATSNLLTGGIGVVALGAIPFLRKPWSPSPWVARGMGALFAIWWMVTALGAHASWVQLAAIPGWFLALLASLQVASGRGEEAGSSWSSLGATVLTGFSHPAGIPIATVQVFLLLLLLRLDSSKRGASPIHPSWGFGVLLVIVVAWGASRMPQGHSWGGRWSDGRSFARKGFSPSLRLGDGFGVDPDPSEDEVALRVWSSRPPIRVGGMVFDTYRNGLWSRTDPLRAPVSSRAYLDYLVSCHDQDSGQPPQGWIHASGSTEGFLLVPRDAGCVGTVEDSVRSNAAGVWSVPGLGRIPRGWMWFRGELPRRTRPQESQVPRGMEDLLDGMLLEAGVSGSDSSDSVTAKISRWFADRFTYSLQASSPAGAEPLAAFLSSREGFCEHFATAGALLARRSGIPSRVVTGYAWPDRIAGAWVFRRSHAHAWVEVFEASRGWVAWDPTPGGIGPVRSRGKWRILLDSWKTTGVRLWHAFRDGSWRLDLERRVESVRWGWATGVLGVVVLGLLGAWTLWRRHRDPGEGSDAGFWREALEKAESRLRRDGLVRMGGETIGGFLRRLPPDAPVQAVRILRQYQENRWKRDQGGKAGKRTR
ncbi:MAG: transglutaminase domain-containing protein [Fibrobacteria bacterium]|nr:transglutaminase domain-containing protein [Fibrobacteria bacterium]